MKNKSTLCLIIISLMMASLKSYSQPYATGIGFRLGGISSGITVKHYLNTNSALEGILSFGRHSMLITGLYEKHQPFPDADGLSWYYGGGAHLGFVNSNYGYYDFYYGSHGNHSNFNDGDATFSLGGDFILGLDYKFENAPINLAIDVKPFIDIIPGFYGYWEGAFTFRFTL